MLHLLSDLTDHWRSLKVKMPTMITQMPTGRIARHSPHPSHRYGPFLHNVARSVVCTFGTGWAVWKCLNQSKCSFGAESCELFKTSLFCKSFPPQPSLSSPGLTPRIPRTVCRYFWAYPFVLFCFFFFFFTFKLSVPCGRLSWLMGTFWAHVK